MAKASAIKIGILKRSELDEANRIFRFAFGTFLGLADPSGFAGDREMLRWRFGARNVQVLAARDGARLIGSNVLTTWGSFGFFGPLTVSPEYWDRGVAQLLMEATVKTFDERRIKRTGLFTFAHSAKHVGLYQKFGYWPVYLTALMTRTLDGDAKDSGSNRPVLLSSLKGAAREEAVAACRRLTNGIERGLDLSEELRAIIAKNSGDVVMVTSGRAMDAFAVCHHGPGSEGGTKICYVKFAAARSGAGAGERFDRLLDACEWFASSRGVAVEAGVNLAREDAYRRMRARGFRIMTQGVAMLRPHVAGHNRADAYVLDDWR